MTWLPAPCSDLGALAFERDGKRHRPVERAREPALRELFGRGIARRLVERGLLAPTRISELETEGHELLVEIAAPAFDVPADRFSRGALRAAAGVWIDAALALCDSGYALCDAHFENFALFGANRPLLADVGCLRKLKDIAAEKPFPSFSAFCVHMVAPLLALHRQPGLARAARLAIADRPANGPLCPPDDGPLELRAISADLSVGAISRAISLSPAMTAVDALLRLRSFLESLAAGAAEEAGHRASPFGPELQQRICAADAGRVVCVGADAYLAQRAELGGRSCLVVEPSPRALDALDHSLRSMRAAERVSAYYGSALNRQFPAARLRGDCAIALDPFPREVGLLGSAVHALAAIARRQAFLCAGESQLKPAVALLEQSFARVRVQPPAPSCTAGEPPFQIHCERGG